MFLQAIRRPGTTAGTGILWLRRVNGRQYKENASNVHVTLTYAVRVRIVGEMPLRVVAEGVDEVGPRDVRLEDEALGAREGDVVEVGRDAAGNATLVVRREVDHGRPGSVRHRRGEEGVRLKGKDGTLRTQII